MRKFAPTKISRYTVPFSSDFALTNVTPYSSPYSRVTYSLAPNEARLSIAIGVIAVNVVIEFADWVTIITKTKQVKIAKLEESNKEFDHGNMLRAQVGRSFVVHSASP